MNGKIEKERKLEVQKRSIIFIIFGMIKSNKLKNKGLFARIIQISKGEVVLCQV